MQYRYSYHAKHARKESAADSACINTNINLRNATKILIILDYLNYQYHTVQSVFSHVPQSLKMKNINTLI